MIGKERIVSPRANRIFLVGEISILERIHFLLMRKKRPPNTIATPQSITKNHFILDCDLCKSLNKVFGIAINANKRKESPACFKILNLRAFPLSLILIMALNTPKISIFQTAMRMSTKRSGPTPQNLDHCHKHRFDRYDSPFSIQKRIKTFPLPQFRGEGKQERRTPHGN